MVASYVEHQIANNEKRKRNNNTKKKRAKIQNKYIGDVTIGIDREEEWKSKRRKKTGRKKTRRKYSRRKNQRKLGLRVHAAGETYNTGYMGTREAREELCNSAPVPHLICSLCLLVKLKPCYVALVRDSS